MSNGQYEQNLPEARILMNSMRAMGYSFESALADVIDNSIAACADVIKILLPSSSAEKQVFIFDNGSGMDYAELFEAMRYGSNIKSRKEQDLGRFGLGLKSASLSQCRKLTVISKKNNTITGMQWDIDYIEEKNDWLVKILTSDEINSSPCIELFNAIEHGTLLIWDNFDTLDLSRGSVYSCIERKISSLDKYLSLIFHRFMSGSEGKKISFYINQKKLSPLDPFLTGHPKTTKNEPIAIPIYDSKGVERMIDAQAFILPHHSDLSPDDQTLLGGYESMKTQQGFYIYRNRRLIIWGSWFGMPKEELSKYARIKVDIPNTLDDIWQIDIKKQHAAIPSSIQASLRRAIEKAKGQSKKKNIHRGSKKADEVKLWYPVNNRGKFEFRINRESSIFHLLSGLDEKSRQTVDLLLDEIENMLPYIDIYNGMAQGNIDTPSDAVDENRLFEIEELALMIWNIHENAGETDVDVILDKIFSTEPFCDYKNHLYDKIKSIKTYGDIKNA